MHVYVKNIKGKLITLKFEPNTKITSILKSLMIKWKWPVDQLRLCFKGKQLFEGTVEENNIQDGDFLVLHVNEEECSCESAEAKQGQKDDQKNAAKRPLKKDELSGNNLSLNPVKKIRLEMEIYVRSMHGHETIILKVNSIDSIKTVKNMIQEKGKYPVTMLVFDNNKLEDTALLSEYNINDGSVLYSNEIRIFTRALQFQIENVLLRDENVYLREENFELTKENAELRAELAKFTDLNMIKIQIVVYNMAGKTITLEVKPCYTIKRVKQMFRATERFPVTRLIFAGEGLKDGSLLSDYNIEDGSTLHAILQLRGD